MNSLTAIVVWLILFFIFVYIPIMILAWILRVIFRIGIWSKTPPFEPQQPMVLNINLRDGGESQEGAEIVEGRHRPIYDLTERN